MTREVALPDGGHVIIDDEALTPYRATRNSFERFRYSLAPA